jgi:hypothetical protein
MPRALTEDEQAQVAQAIVDDLKLNNWRFEQGHREGKGPNIMKP